MYEVLYVNSEYWATNDSDSFGPYYYAVEAQEKCDEMNGESYG